MSDTMDRTRHEAGTRATHPTLEAVRGLAPDIADRADEIERGRRLPPEVVARLRDAGCFRMLLARRYGGDEADLHDHLRMIRELARADGSVGWTVMIGSSAPFDLRNLPTASYADVYARGPDVVMAGSFNPTGSAVAVDGGYRAAGRWSFASGAQHADLFLAHSVVPDGREPPVRMMVLPASDVEVLDTWHVSGMCGTGSHDFTVDDVFVPEDRSFTVFEEQPGATTLARLPELVFTSLAIASVAIGIAEGSLGDVVALAGGKVPMFADATLAANPLFRRELAEADALQRATVALLEDEVRLAWRTAEAGEVFTPEHRARVRATATWVTGASARVVDAAYTLGGGTSLRLECPLQRRFRDVHALTQHFVVKPDTFTLAGGVLAGQDVDLTFL